MSNLPLYPGIINRLFGDTRKFTNKHSCGLDFDENEFYDNADLVVECLQAKRVDDLISEPTVDSILAGFFPFHTPSDDFPWNAYEQLLDGSTISSIESLVIGHTSQEFGIALPFLFPDYFSYDSKPSNKQLPGNLTHLDDFKKFIIEKLLDQGALLPTIAGVMDVVLDIAIGEPKQEADPMNFVKRFLQNANRVVMCGIRMYSNDIITRSANGNAKVYMYKFSQPFYDLQEALGVPHNSDLGFVFGIPLLQPDKFNYLDIEMSKRLMKSYSHFARTGEMPDQLGQEWKLFKDDEQFVLELKGGRVNFDSKDDEKFCDAVKLIFELAA